MCSFFSQRMENDHGNLSDMIRASSSSCPTATELNIADWSFTPDHEEPLNLQPSMDGHFEDFGSPSMNFHQPLLQELAGMPLIGSPEPPVGLEMGPCNIFSRVLQMDPAGTARVSARAALQPSPLVVGGGASSHAVARMSAPTPGIKRRKGQARKVICVPAPAATSSKSSGEVVPSDLWAWRKYGQKPIKGSPYPRGYYRCSSSKGCSARKQVERSRSDPNMLVITYTSEHNHPWPTQRNALAGSTRSQPAKNNSSTSNNGPQIQRPPSKEEKKVTSSSVTPVKEEVTEIAKEMDAGYDRDFDHVFQHEYHPLMSELNQPDDFFTDLGELEADPMDLNFTEGLLEHKTDDQGIRASKDLDHFSFFDWAGNSFGEAKDGL